MNEQILNCIAQYPEEITALFMSLRQLVFESVSQPVEERLWAKLPSYYVGERFVRLIPFKDHINVEARSIANRKEHLADYKITPKGMLQIFVNQPIPVAALRQIFAETLTEAF